MISFIIPTKNEEKVIEKILRCLSEYKGEKEIIVSDGRSTDQTVSTAKRYAKVVEGKENGIQNISIGKNAGARAGHGEYLVFTDADVYIPDINSFFEKAISFFESDKNLIGLTVQIRVSKNQETLADKIIFSILNHYILILNNYLKIGAAVGEFQMFRREIFEKAGGYDENLPAAEDFEFFGRVAKIGKTYSVKDLTIYHSGRREHSIGWPRLLMQWWLNGLFVFLRKRTYTKEWKVIR